MEYSTEILNTGFGRTCKVTHSLFRDWLCHPFIWSSLYRVSVITRGRVLKVVWRTSLSVLSQIEYGP